MLASTTLLLLINSVRQPKLVSDINLVRLAQERCITMPTFSHDLFNKDYRHRIENLCNRYSGENLYLGNGTAQEAFKLLENSKTHKANNHKKEYTKIGIATCTKPGNINLTVILFAGK